MNKISIYSFALILLVSACFAQAQRPALTAADYDRAVKKLDFNTGPLVDKAGVRPNFLPDGRFWYRVNTPSGKQYVLVDPTNGTRKTGDSVAALGVTTPTNDGGKNV